MILRSIGTFLLTLPVLAGDPALVAGAKSPIVPAPEYASPWRVGVGTMWRNIGELSVRPGLQNSRFADRFFVAPPGAGETGSFGDRTYDDGFVNIGAATPATGLTSHWGYQNDSQVGGGALDYTLGGGSAQTLPGSARDSEGLTPAPYLELSYLRPVGPDLVAGFTTHLSLAGLDGRTSSAMNSSSVTLIDRYPLGGVIPPSAPYAGSFAGPGPLISNQPASRDFILTPDGARNHQFEHDTDLYSLAFGAEIHWQPAERCYLGLGAGAVINLADWNASWSAPVPNSPGVGTTMIGDNDSGHDFLWGLYLKAIAGYRIHPQWSIEGFFRYDWNETLRGSVSPTSFELGLTGWSAGIGVAYHF